MNAKSAIIVNINLHRLKDVHLVLGMFADRNTWL